MQYFTSVYICILRVYFQYDSALLTAISLFFSAEIIFNFQCNTYNWTPYSCKSSNLQERHDNEIYSRSKVKKVNHSQESLLQTIFSHAYLNSLIRHSEVTHITARTITCIHDHFACIFRIEYMHYTTLRGLLNR